MRSRVRILMAFGVLFIGLCSVANAWIIEEFEIAVHADDQFAPAIGQDTVVWHDDCGSWRNPYGYDLNTGTEFEIVSQGHNPDVDEGIAVWHMRGHIYGHDIAAETDFTISDGPGAKYHPRISGDTVVWHDWRNGNRDIYGYDLATGTEFATCTDPSNQQRPAVFEDIVVWRDDRGLGGVYGYDITKGIEFPVCSAAGRQNWVDIWGDTVVWEDNRNGDYDIYSYDLTKGEEARLSTDPGNQRRPAIYENMVVWHDDRNGASMRSEVKAKSIPTCRRAVSFARRSGGHVRRLSEGRCQAPQI